MRMNGRWHVASFFYLSLLRYGLRGVPLSIYHGPQHLLTHDLLKCQLPSFRNVACQCPQLSHRH